MKTCKILSMEQSANCPEMKHYTVLYRGREYTVTTNMYDSPVYEVGAEYYCETYKYPRGGTGIYILGKAKKEA